MDVWTDGQKDGQTDGRTDRRTDRPFYAIAGIRKARNINPERPKLVSSIHSDMHIVVNHFDMENHHHH